MDTYEIGIKCVTSLNNVSSTICSPDAPRGPARSGARVIVYGVTGIPRSVPATRVLQQWHRAAFVVCLDDWATLGHTIPWGAIADIQPGQIVRHEAIVAAMRTGAPS